jgi:hypothetical protein
MSLLGVPIASVQDRSFPSVRRPLDSSAVERIAAGSTQPETPDLAAGVRIDAAEAASAGTFDRQFTASNQEASTLQTYSKPAFAQSAEGTGSSGPQVSIWPAIWPPIWPPIWNPAKLTAAVQRNMSASESEAEQ